MCICGDLNSRSPSTLFRVWFVQKPKLSVVQIKGLAQTPSKVWDGKPSTIVYVHEHVESIRAFFTPCQHLVILNLSLQV